MTHTGLTEVTFPVHSDVAPQAVDNEANARNSCELESTLDNVRYVKS